MTCPSTSRVFACAKDEQDLTLMTLSYQRVADNWKDLLQLILAKKLPPEVNH